MVCHQVFLLAVVHSLFFFFSFLCSLFWLVLLSGACTPCKSTCTAGKELLDTCTNQTDNTCEQCQSGFFKSSAGAQACTACRSSCGPGVFLNGACTPTQDRFCQICASGSYKLSTNADPCDPCVSSCPAGQELNSTCTTTNNPTSAKKKTKKKKKEKEREGKTSRD